MKRFFNFIISSFLCLGLCLLVGCSFGSNNESKSSETESHIHSFSEWVIVEDSTCKKVGLKERTCECGEKETETIAMKNHSYDYENGVWQWKINDATGEYTAEYSFKCSVCQHQIEVPGTITSVSTPGTCTVKGSVTYTAKAKVEEIEYTDTKVIEGEYADHTWNEGEITTPATCTEDGVKTFTCSCGATKTEVVTKLGHDLIEDAAISATCTTDGITAGHHCSRCDYTDGKEVVTKLGHDYSVELTSTAIPATCTTDGKEADHKCSRCESVETGDIITKLGHDYSIELTSTAIPATCTTDGKEADHKCSRCESVETGAIITKFGHTEVEIPAVPATYDNAGSTSGKKCSVCELVLEEPETIDKLKYTLTFELNGGTLPNGITTIDVYKGTSASELANFVPTKACSSFDGWFMTVGENEVEIPSTATVTSNLIIIAHWTENHLWGEYVYNNDQTDFESGTKTRTCATCSQTETIDDPEHPARYINVFAAPSELLLSYQVNGGTSTANLPYSADSQLRVGLINNGYEFVNNKGEARDAAAASFLATKFPTTIEMLSTMNNYVVIATVTGMDNSSVDTGNVGFGLVFGFYNGKPICFNVQENSGFKNVIFADGVNSKTINTNEAAYSRLGTYEYVITVNDGVATIVINGNTITTFTMPEGSIPAIGTVMRNQNARYTDLALYILNSEGEEEESESTNVVVAETGNQNIYNVFSNSTEPCGSAKPKVAQISNGVYALVNSENQELSIDNFTQGDFYGSKFNTTKALTENISEYTVSCTVTGTGNKGSLYGMGMTFGFYKGLPMVFVVQGGNLGIFNYATGVNTALKSFAYTSGLAYSSTGTYDIVIHVKDGVAAIEVNDVTVGTYDIPTEETFVPAIGVALRNSTAEYKNFEMVIISTIEE